jgi:hypothetical protein
VHRALALLLIPALIATSGVHFPLHTHVYDDHDHPEHHHGLAAHEHHQAAPHSDDASPHLEPCDPAKHTLSFAFVCAAPPQVHVDLAGLPGPTIAVPSIPIRSAPVITDVRVHSPPFAVRIPSRGPPLTHLA